MKTNPDIKSKETIDYNYNYNYYYCNVRSFTADEEKTRNKKKLLNYVSRPVRSFENVVGYRACDYLLIFFFLTPLFIRRFGRYIFLFP